MQLRIQRSQREGGLAGNIIIFCVDVRADYSPEERSNINRYKIGRQIIYNSQAALKHLNKADEHLAQGGTGLIKGIASIAMAKLNVNISIASLSRGHHIECKDLEELLAAEETIMAAAKTVVAYLAAAATFNGSEILITYENGQEQIHTSQNAQRLIEIAPPVPMPGTVSVDYSAAPDGSAPLIDHLMHWLENPLHILYASIGLILLACFVLVVHFQ